MARLSSLAVFGVVCLSLAGCTPGPVSTPSAPSTVVATGPTAQTPGSSTTAVSTPVQVSSAEPSVGTASAGPSIGALPILCSKPGSTPVPCTADEKINIQSQGDAYSRADGVYREVVAEQLNTLKRGGAGESRLFSLTADPLKSLLTEDLRSIRENQNSATGGPTRVKWVAAAPAKATSTYPVALEVCEDSTDVQFYRKGVKSGKGHVVRAYQYFTLSGGVILLARQEEGAGTC